MKITPETIRAKLLLHLEAAKQELQRTKPSTDIGTSNLPITVTGVWEYGERQFKAGFSNDTEKRIWGRTISEAAKLTHAKAVIVRIASTQFNGAKIEAELGLDAATFTTREYEHKLLDWVEAKTGSRKLASLPRHYTTDTIIICALGPRLPDMIIGQPYEWQDDHYHFPPMMDFTEKGSGQINVIPKWWI